MMRHRFAACGILLIALALPRPLLAADTPSRSALEIVPADAAFFASWSRQGEQLDILRESNAFTQFMEISQVRDALGPLLLGEFDLDEPDHVTMKQWLSQPFVQVGLDALSHEVFVYGDASFTEMVNHAQEMMWSGTQDRLEALVAGKTGHQAGLAADAAVIRRLNKFRLPNLVFGFKPKDPLRARSQLMLLDGLTHIALARKDVPPWVRKQYGRETIQGQQFLTFTLTGSMVFDQIEFERPPDVQLEMMAAMIRAFRRLRTVVAIGFLNDYVILSVGGTTSHLHRLGQEKPLSSHPDMARIKEAGDKQCTSIHYVASDYRSLLAAYSGRQASFDELFKQSLADGKALSDETRAKAESALSAFQSEKKKQQERKPSAASLGFAYLTKDGYEGFSYGEAGPDLNPTHPMSVLLHTGTDPFGVVAQRNWLTVDDYVRFSEQVAKILERLEKWLLAEEEEEQLFARDQYRILAEQLDTIVRQQIVPALVGGQAVLVISATERSQQWHPEMPVAEPPLALPEVGLVVETHDSKAFLNGITEAYQVIEAVVRSVSPAAREIPPLEPEVEDTAMGQLHYIPMWPELTKINPDLLAPTAGLSDRWLVLSLRPKTAAALLKPTGWSPSERALDSVTPTSLTYLRPAALVQIALDWLHYAEQNLEEEPGEDDAAVLAVYRGMLRLVGCLKSYTRTVDRDGSTSVTHTVWRFKDQP